MEKRNGTCAVTVEREETEEETQARKEALEKAAKTAGDVERVMINGNEVSISRVLPANVAQESAGE